MSDCTAAQKLKAESEAFFFFPDLESGVSVSKAAQKLKAESDAKINIFKRKSGMSVADTQALRAGSVAGLFWVCKTRHVVLVLFLKRIHTSTFIPGPARNCSLVLQPTFLMFKPSEDFLLESVPAWTRST